MPGFRNIKEFADTVDDGKIRFTAWRKSPTQVTTIGIWFDLSMSPGMPVPQYYAASPLTATVLARSTDGGLDHGGNLSPSSKFLKNLMVMTTTATALPMQMILCDYLLYYAFVDEGTTDEQLMTNTNILTRYTDGVGVQMMAVVVGAHTGGQTFSVKYTNSDGVADRVSQTVRMTTAQFVNGTILTSERATALSLGPFIPLQSGDKGVRSIQSVTCNGLDVGIFTLVLVKPLAQLNLRGVDAPVEKEYFLNHAQLPLITDDAFLSFICCPSGSLAATALHGYMSIVWN